jgi:c-di-GMP-binding flagellar brake protein YcgR
MSPANPPSDRAEPQLRFELTDAHDYSQYLVRSQAEILFLLRGIQKKGQLLTVYFNRGDDFLLTAVLEVRDDGVVLDCGADAETNRRALAADRLTLITSLDKVKVQFSATTVKASSFDGRPAFLIPLPDSVLRLQRREYYRLITPVLHPLRCKLPLANEDGSTSYMEAQVIDISGGGLAVMAPPSGIVFEMDMRFPNCQLELPDIGTVKAGLRVRNCFEVTLRNGNRVRRCGCEFVDLSPAMRATIERYIMKVERERKARESGLG